MFKKKMLSMLTLALILAFTASLGWAKSEPKADAKTPPVATEKMMSPEDRAALQTLREEHRKKMEPVHNQMWAKEMEYQALVGNSNAKVEDVRAVIGEMVKLKEEMQAERTRFAAELKEKKLEAGFPFHQSRTYHNGGLMGKDHQKLRGDCPMAKRGDCPKMKSGFDGKKYGDHRGHGIGDGNGYGGHKNK